MTQPKIFWMVQGPHGGAHVRHDNRGIAESEASRLAAKTPGQAFSVMQAVATYQSVSTTRVSLDGLDTGGSIPF